MCAMHLLRAVLDLSGFRLPRTQIEHSLQRLWEQHVQRWKTFVFVVTLLLLLLLLLSMCGIVDAAPLSKFIFN